MTIKSTPTVYHIENDIIFCGSRWGSPYLTQEELKHIIKCAKNTVKYYEKNQVNPEELNAQEAIAFDKIIRGK